MMYGAPYATENSAEHRTILPGAVCIAWNVGVAMPRGKLKGGQAAPHFFLENEATVKIQSLDNLTTR